MRARTIAAAAALIAPLALWSCDEQFVVDPEDGIAVELQRNAWPDSLLAGQEAELEIRIVIAGSDERVAAPTVIWTVDDSAYATLEQDTTPGRAILRARKPGIVAINAIINATENLQRQEFDHTATISLDSVTILGHVSDTTATAIGDTIHLAARGVGFEGALIEGTGLSWTATDHGAVELRAADSADAALAVVAATGTDTVTVAHTACVTGPCVDTVVVTVEQVPASISVSPDAVTLLSLGEEVELQAAVEDGRASPIADAIVTWTLADPADTAVISLSASGSIASLADGDAQVVAASGDALDTVKVTVRQTAVSLALSADTLELPFGTKDTVTASLADALGNAMAGAVTATWVSRDSTIAAVATIGAGKAAEVTAIGAGRVWVSAESEGPRDSVLITVPPDSVTIMPSEDSTAIGGSVSFTATAFDGNGLGVAEAVFQWTTADASIATVDSIGAVEGMTAGKTDVIASIDGVADTASVVVYSTAVDSVAVTPDTVTMEAIGDTARLEASGYAAIGIQLEASFQWTSADTTLATVDSAGLVTAMDRGTTWVRATADGLTDSARVIIAPTPASILVLAGDGQTGSSGPLADSLIVRVLDAGGTYVAAATVVWAADGGELSPDTSVTDTTGRAATLWSLPFSSGTFTATATAADSVSASFTATVNSLPGDRRCVATGVEHGGTISADEVWLASDNPHVVTGDVTVNNGAALTVQAGAVVCLDAGTSLAFEEQANLVARGTASDTIVFTASNLDDPWDGVTFTAPTPDTSYLTNVRVEHATGRLVALESHTLVVDSSRLRQIGGIALASPRSRLARTAIDSAGYTTGLIVSGDSAVIVDVTVRGSVENGASIHGKGATISGLRVEDSGGWGLYSPQGAVASAAGVRVQGSASYGAHLGIDVLARIAPTPADQDSLLGNGRDTLVILYSRLSRDTVTARGDVPWRVDADLTIDTFSLLVAEPGARFGVRPGYDIRFDNASRLDARGTADSPVVFTSMAPVIAGDPEPWGRLEFRSQAPITSTLKNVVVEYSDGSPQGSIWAPKYPGGESHRLVLDSVRVRRSAGVSLESDSSAILRSSIDSVSYGAFGLRMGGFGIRAEEIVVRESPGMGVRASSFGGSIHGARIVGSGDIGLWITAALRSASGIRIIDGDSYPAELDLDQLALIAPTPVDQDSLLGNAKDTLRITGGRLYNTDITVRAMLPWQVIGSPVVDTFSTLTVEPGGHLAFGSGTSIDFRNAGTLAAVGTADSIITLTALDRPTQLDPDVDPWAGLDFRSPIPDTSVLTHVLLEHSNGPGNVGIQADSPHVVLLEDSRVRQSGEIRIEAPGSRLTRLVVDSSISHNRAIHMLRPEGMILEDVTVRGSAGVGIEFDFPFPGVNGGARLEGVRIENSGGIGLVSEFNMVDSAQDVRITGGASYPVKVRAEILTKLAPTPADQDSLLGNAKDTLWVTGGSISVDYAVRPDVPWIAGNVSVIDSAVFSLGPGARIAFTDHGALSFREGGHLEARGNATEPVVLTSVDQPTPLEPDPQPWSGIDFISSLPDTSYLANVIVEYSEGGSASCSETLDAGGLHAVIIDSTRFRHTGKISLESPGSRMVRSVVDTAKYVETSCDRSAVTMSTLYWGSWGAVETDSIVFRGNIIRNSSQNGLYLRPGGSHLAVDGNEITGSTQAGIVLHDCSNIANNNVVRNDVGIRIKFSFDCVADSLWWGDSVGPPGTNGSTWISSYSAASLTVNSWLAEPVTVQDVAPPPGG